MKSIVALLAAILVFAASLASAQDNGDANSGRKIGLEAIKPNEHEAQVASIRLATAIEAAKSSPKDPQAFMNIFYAASAVLSQMIWYPPNWQLFDQFDAFFYVAELLPQQYQLNYVKRV
ncbi:uncharacterized protein LOC129769806 [Toxorhynchites rutilus septentrionalis]|uniref:uncharacterized protein LOC129769806 n=1 Tax=Toxorhynchites rutilus septentrionalis TaxID=329112 RepID=UPI002478F81E|nr:uncharacterized protein LOC129769806 [Toxorhynchites rutilus septentrionalis]